MSTSSSRSPSACLHARAPCGRPCDVDGHHHASRIAHSLTCLPCCLPRHRRTLTDKQRELMEQFAEEEEKHPKAGFLKETIDRIKQYIKG